MLSFLVVASFGVSGKYNKKIEVPQIEVLSYQTTDREFVDLPALKEQHEDFPILSAQAVLAVDVDSGVYLFEKDPDQPFLPASTTKIITALVALDTFSQNDVLIAFNPGVDGQKMRLVAGEQMTFGNMLKGLLIMSANDAAKVIAQNYPGGEEDFVVAMNEKTGELGLFDSYFTNPAGLDNFEQVTTARDMAILGIYAMQNKKFAEVVQLQAEVVTSTDGQIVHNLKTTNLLLGNVDGVVGIKTGWTENARENLITFVERDGKTIVIALLGSQDRFGETEQLINWIMQNYEWQKVEVAL